MVKKILPMLLGLLGLAATAQAQTCTGSLGVAVAGSTTGLPLTATETHANSACNTGSTPQVSGTITLSVLGGSPYAGSTLAVKYHYNWTKDGSAFTAYTDGSALTNLGAGSYMVTITDNAAVSTATTTPASTNANCSYVVGPVVIAEPTAVSPTFAANNAAHTGFGVSCNIAAQGTVNDGTVVASATGGTPGTPAYTFNIGGGVATNNTGTFTGLTAGAYTVTITDGNGCTATASATLTTPTTITSSLAMTSNFNSFGVSCTTNQGTVNNGQVTATAAGGTTVFQYSLNGGAYQSSIVFNTLTAGNYTVTVRDQNMCTTTSTVTVTTPTPIVAGISVTSNHNGTQISCTPGQGVVNDGQITTTASGAVPAYTFALGGTSSAPAQASGVFGTLAAGSYTVTITDQNTCSTITSVTIVAPTPITAPGVTTNLACNQTAGNGGATGAIDLSPAGGTPAYSYAWTAAPAPAVPNPSATVQDQSALVAGTYTVIVTDLNSCTQSASFVIAQPAPITFTTAPSNYNGFGVSCNTAMPSGATHPTNISNNGTITVNGAAGGTGAYSYSNGSAFQAGNVFSTLTPNTYTVTVKDINGCTASSTQAITQPTQLLAGTCTAANDLCQLNTGQIKVEVVGGVTPYGVTWSAVGTACQGTPAATPAQVITTSGGNVIYNGVTGNCTYNFVVTDANGCSLP